MKRVIVFVLMLVFVTVFLVSAWNLVSYFLEANENNDLYEDLASRVEDPGNVDLPPVYFTPPTHPNQPTTPTDPADSDDPTEPADPTEPTIIPEYAQLYLENPDMVGWIQLEGTQLNYPVMQTPDRENYYLKRNFYGEYSSRGCIYADENCDVFTPSDNVTLYGHNMYDGSMFTALLRYNSKTFLENNPYITFNTLLERRTYEVIAVFKTTASVGEGFRYHTFINADSEEEFNEFVATCKRLSFFDIEATAEYGDKLLTLSTCEYTQTNGRFVVVAKLIQTEEIDPTDPQP